MKRFDETTEKKIRRLIATINQQSGDALKDINVEEEIRKIASGVMPNEPTDLCYAQIVNGHLSNAVKIKMPVSEEDKTIFSYKGGFPLTALGYNKINAYTKISIIKPNSLMHEGKIKENPYIIRDGGSIVGAKIRGTGIGYTIGGGIVVLDHVLYYDISNMLAMELYNKVMQHPKSGFIAPEKYQEIPESYIAKTKYYDQNARKYLYKEEKYSTVGRMWKYMPLDDAIGGIYYDLSHEEIRKVIQTHLGRLSTLTTRLETAITKNILKKHPAININEAKEITQKQGLDGKPTYSGMVTFNYWRPALEEKTISKIKDLINSGKAYLTNEDLKDISQDIVIQQASATIEEDEPDIKKEVADETIETVPESEEDLNERIQLTDWIKRNSDKAIGILTKGLEDYSVSELKEVKEQIIAMKKEA